MMDTIVLGFAQILTLNNIGLCLVGALVGTLIGVLPGLGPLATLAILLPITFSLPPRRRAADAGRRLLRIAIWRLDHGDPGEICRASHPLS